MISMSIMIGFVLGFSMHMTVWVVWRPLTRFLRLFSGSL